MRLQVHLQREIARLHHYDPTLSNARIAKAVGASPTTVGIMMKKVKACPASWEALAALDDNDFRKLLETADRTIAQTKPHPNWSWVHEQMQLPDATLSEIWKDWRETNPAGIGQSRFCELYAEWVGSREISMRQAHQPGNKLFVDFAGRKVEIRDREGGPSLLAKIFVAVLGYSNWTFVLAVPSESTGNWVQCHVECFGAMGGVPEWVVPDNLKAAVLSRTHDGEIILNRAYRDMLGHYDTAAMPAPPRKPKGKSKAEVGVQIVQRWVLFKLRNRVFFSIAELNEAIRPLVAALNERAFRKMDGNRIQRFVETEKEALKPLPDRPYEYREWRYNALVEDDHHINFDRNSYSVPFTKARHLVDIRANANVVEIYCDNIRVAVHPRLTGRGKASTLPEHRPAHHIAVLEGEPEMLIRWARTLGPCAEQLIRYHVEERADVTNGVKAARKIRSMVRDNGDINERFEQISAYALRHNMMAVRHIESILKSGRDRGETPLPPKSIGAHENIRGASYFGGDGQ
jgi:transposase